MEISKNERFLAEEMISKGQDPDTSQDELVGILADILIEAFIWQEEQKHTPTQEKAPQERKRVKKAKSFEDGGSFYL